MIGGILIQSKRYTRLDYISVLLMTLGLIWFTKVDKTLNTEFNFTGVLYICSALVFDAFLGNFQEKVFKEYRMSQAELMTFSFTFGAWALFVIVAADGSIVEGYRALRGSAPSSINLVLALAFCGFIGINLVLSLVKVFHHFHFPGSKIPLILQDVLPRFLPRFFQDLTRLTNSFVPGYANFMQKKIV